METGQYIKDNEVVWIVIDVRDNHMAGDIVFRHTLMQGYIKCNGAKVKGSDYPRLVALAEEMPAILSYDIDTDELTIVDLRERMIQGADEVGLREAGLPNIEGTPGDSLRPIDTTITTSGAFAWKTRTGNVRALYNSSSGMPYQIMFNASKFNPIYGNSDTVQPSALALIPQIKY